MKKRILSFLALCFAAMAVPASAEFTVHCEDESGAPIAGAKIQLCTDIACLLKKSDLNGDAVFDVDAGSYSIHALDFPEEYAEPEEMTSAETDSGAVLVFRAVSASRAGSAAAAADPRQAIKLTGLPALPQCSPADRGAGVK